MPQFDPEKLAAWSSGIWYGDHSSRKLEGFSIDTRKLKSGEIFVAIKTDSNDGHNYLEKAKQNGASAAIVEKQIPEIKLPQLVVQNVVLALMDIARLYRLEFEGKVIGITGSCGKTSTKDALALFMGSTITCKTEANLNNKLGMSLTLLELDSSTHEYAVVEVGVSELGEMEELVKILQPDSAILTLIGEAHISGLGNLDSVAHEKYKLLESVKPEGFALFPFECLEYTEFIHDVGSHWILCDQVYKSGTKDHLCYNYILSKESGVNQLSLTSSYFNEVRFNLPSRVVSPGTVRNLAMSLGVCMRLGINYSALKERLLEWRPSELRGEIWIGDGQIFYVDCYNSNPVSMKEALIGFSNEFPRQPRLFVLGCMNELGSESIAIHKQVGESVSLSSNDSAILCGDESEALRAGMLESGVDSSSITIVDHVEDARSLIETFEGAILLKGSRTYGLETLLPTYLKSSERSFAIC
jgi:UDP-N-acetylmuramoyl-tripeptide--D-alanyl-D-alanine ligase